MDAKFSVIFNGEIVDDMVIAEVEKNLQQHYKLSEQKSKQFLSKQRTVKKDLTKKQALQLQKKLLINGMKTQLLNDSSQITSVDENILCRSEIDKIFQGKMTPIKSSLSYNAGLFLTLLLTLCIPIIYLIITGSVIYGTGFFIANMSTWFNFQQAAHIKIPLAFSVIFMGVLLSFFLLRPLIPQSNRNDSDEILDAAEHPDLFYLIQKLSTYMSVPMPCEIRMNHEVNASASLKDGIGSFKNGQLVLTLGYPLVSGMNTRQLIGVIAHEFGHFSQRYGMAAYCLINTVNFWLQERAYAKYGLALLLSKWRAKYDESYLLVPIFTASAGIWLSQQCLKQLFHMSLYFSQRMSREMEFNADHHECKIVGSDYFSVTSIRIHQLSFAQNKVSDINDHFWNENALLKNMPKAINTLTNNLSKREKETVQGALDLQDSHPWDSHPADNQRINHALTLNEVGIFHIELEAGALFKNYEDLCEKRTLGIYNTNSPNRFNDKVVDNDILFSMQKEDEQSVKLLRISQFSIDLQGRLANILVKLPEELKNISLQEIDALYLDIDPQVRKDVSHYSSVKIKRLLQHKAYAYLQAGFDIEHDEFQLSEREASRITPTLDQTESSFKKCEASFKHYDQFITAKILASLKQKPKAILMLAQSHIKVLKTIKNIEEDMDNIRIYSACINMLLNDDNPCTAINEMVAQYQKQLVPVLSSVLQKISDSCAVNRFSNEPLTLLDFAHSWHSKPTSEIGALRVQHLTSYAVTVCNSLMKQHDLHLRKLLICGQ